MTRFSFAIFLVLAVTSLFVSQTSAKQCVDAKDVNPDKNPILKTRYPAKIVDQFGHSFDSQMAAGQFIRLYANFDFNQNPGYHLEIKATNFAVAGPYVIIATFADGSEQWRWLQGEDDCDGSFQSLPIKVELAIVDFDKMKAQEKKDSQACIYIPIDQVPTLENHYPIAKQSAGSLVFDSQLKAINAHVTADFSNPKTFQLKVAAPDSAHPPTYVFIVGDAAGGKEHIWIKSGEGCKGKYRINMPTTLELATIKDTSGGNPVPPKTKVKAPDAKRIASQQCLYVDGNLPVNRKPIVKQQYPITAKAGATNIWDGGVQDVKNRITLDASKGSTFTLSSTITDYAAPGPYLVIVTTSNAKRTIWIQGGDGCHGQDLGGIPTKVELATLDFDAMKARDARLAQKCILAQPPLGPKPNLLNRYPIAGGGKEGSIKYDGQIADLKVNVTGQMPASLDTIHLNIDAPEGSLSTTYVIILKDPKTRSEKFYYLKSNDGCNGIYWGGIPPTLELATISKMGKMGISKPEAKEKKPVACLYANAGRKSQRPTLKKRYTVGKKGEVWDDNVKELNIHVSASFVDSNLLHLGIQNTKTQPVSNYVIVATFADGLESWLYLKGQDNCIAAAFIGLPTKIEVAQI